MNYSELLGIKNNTFEDVIKILPASNFGFVLEFENVTDKYLYLMNLKKEIMNAFDNYSNNIEFAAPLTFIYSLILILGVIGNIMTCIVIIKSPSLRNVTNYYLFNLAISDLLLLISGIILHLQLLWMKYFLIGGIVLCKVLPYLYDVAYKVSVLTVFAFSFERYLAICHPLSFRNVKTLKRTITSIIVLWIVGLIFSLNQLFQHLIKYVFQFSSDLIIDPENLLACDYIDKLNRYINDYLNFFIFFILPMIVITILYIKMGQKLRDSCQKNTLNYGKSCRQFQSRQSSIKMLSM